MVAAPVAQADMQDRSLEASPFPKHVGNMDSFWPAGACIAHMTLACALHVSGEAGSRHWQEALVHCITICQRAAAVCCSWANQETLTAASICPLLADRRHALRCILTVCFMLYTLDQVLREHGARSGRLPASAPASLCYRFTRMSCPTYHAHWQWRAGFDGFKSASVYKAPPKVDIWEYDTPADPKFAALTPSGFGADRPLFNPDEPPYEVERESVRRL